MEQRRGTMNNFEEYLPFLYFVCGKQNILVVDQHPQAFTVKLA